MHTGFPSFAYRLPMLLAGVLTMAAVYDPMRDELFTAERGKGAWLNGRTLRALAETEISHSLLVTGFPYDIRTTTENNLDHFSRFSIISQGVRRLGSAALDLCYVAAGRFDGYWELSLKPWDLAAGALVALEAGVTVTAVDGQADFMVQPYSVLAANPAIHGKMLKILQEKA